MVEDGAAGYTERGSGWNWSAAGHSWTMRYVRNDQHEHPSQPYAIWNTVLGTSGPYALQAFVPASNVSTQSAHYDIVLSPWNRVPRTISQAGNEGRWVDLGDNMDNFYTSAYVELRNATGEAEDSTWVGFDAMKFYQSKVYLPDIRSGQNSWDTAIYIRNNGNRSTRVVVELYDQNGNRRGNPHVIDNVSPREQVYYNPLVTNWRGSAIVYAAENVSVGVTTTNSASGGTYAYQGFSDESTPGRHPANTVYVPVVTSNYYGFDTKILVQNTGDAATTVNLQYFNEYGQQVTSRQEPISAKGQASFVGAGHTRLTSVKITSFNNQPIAVIAHHNRGNVYQAHAGLAYGGRTVYAPSLQHNYYGWNTALTLQNIGHSDTNVDLFYYDSAGREYRKQTRIRAKGLVSLYTPVQGLTSGRSYSVRVESSGEPLVGVVTASYSANGQIYKGLASEAFVTGQSSGYVPAVSNNHTSARWTNAVAVQNIGRTRGEGYLKIYTNNGQHYEQLGPWGLNPSVAKEWYFGDSRLGINTAFGSGQLDWKNGQPFVAISNHNAVAYPHSDMAFSYGADLSW